MITLLVLTAAAFVGGALNSLAGGGTFVTFPALLFAGLLSAQTAEHPISALPYTPSLDIPSMDRSVDPCTNFYLYSCGGWIKRNPIPPDQPRWNVYAKLGQDNQMFLWGILEEAAKPMAEMMPEMADLFGVLVTFTQLRLYQWDDLLAAAQPKSVSPLAQALWRYSRAFSLPFTSKVSIEDLRSLLPLSIIFQAS